VLGLRLLPKQVSNKNFILRLSLCDAVAREHKLRHDSKRLSRDRAIARATEWSQQLAKGEVASRAALARREGVSRAYVTQVLRRTCRP
jgi:hypothetical protein